MQILVDAREVQNAARMYRPDADAVDAVLTASQSLIAVTTRSLGAAAETKVAQYRALAALDVAPSTAGRMCDRLVRKGLIRRYRARADRSAVLVSVTAASLPRRPDHLVRAAGRGRS